MIVHVNNSFRPRKKPKKKPTGPIAQKLNRKDIEKLLTSKIPTYSVSSGKYKSICIDRAGGAGRQSMTDARFLANESEETRKEILRKANSIAPAYSKGAYQYVSSEEDAKYVGRKL
jgi:hypothetical protein